MLRADLIPRIPTALLLAASAMALERPAYTLPDPLVSFAGERIASAEAWRSVRRPELLAAFRDEVFGNAPVGRPADLAFAVSQTRPGVQQVVASFSGAGGTGSFPFTIHLPPGDGRVPAVVLINHRRPGTAHPAAARRTASRWRWCRRHGRTAACARGTPWSR